MGDNNSNYATEAIVEKEEDLKQSSNALKKKLNNIVLTPNELVLKLLNAMAFRKGKVLFTEIINFISEELDLGIDYLQRNKKYAIFIIGSIVLSKNLILVAAGKEIEDKMSFFYSINIDVMFDHALSDQYKHVELHLTKEKLWQYLTGEKENGESVLGAKTFELLLEIAYHKEKGIDRVALCKSCNQDLRSMPSRLKALEKYTVNINAMTKGRITQYFWHKKFSSSGASKTDALNTRSAEKLLIMEKLKESPDGIREIGDLKEELEIIGDRKKGKRFRLNYFWLDSHKYLQRILVKSENNGKIYFCLKHLKDFSLNDDDTNMGNDDDDEDEYDLYSTLNSDTDLINYTPISNECIGNFEYFSSNTHFKTMFFGDAKTSVLNKVFQNEFIIKSLVENSGKEGLSSMDICNNVFSNEFIKPFNKFLTSHIKQSTELKTDLENNPSQLVKVYDFDGKTKHFRIFTNEAYQKKYGSEALKFNNFVVHDLNSNTLTQKGISKNFEMTKQTPYWLDHIELENGEEEYFWVNNLPPVLKKQMQVLRNRNKGKAVKKQKINNSFGKATKIEVSKGDIEIDDVKVAEIISKADDVDVDLQVANSDVSKQALSKNKSRLKNLSTVTSLSIQQNNTKMEKKKFGDLLGHSIRSVKTQKALLSLIEEHKGLFCYFDKYIIKDVREKMSVSYDIDKKVLKRDILNLMEVKKIKTFHFDNQIYLTFPVVTKEQVEYFHGNKLADLKKKIGFEKNMSLKEKFLEKLNGKINISENTMKNSGNLINNEFITPTTECIVRKEMYFQVPSKKKEFEKKLIVKIKEERPKSEVKKLQKKKKKEPKVNKTKKTVISRVRRVSKPEESSSRDEFRSIPKEIIPEPESSRNEHPLLSYLNDDYVQYSYAIDSKSSLSLSSSISGKGSDVVKSVNNMKLGSRNETENLVKSRVIKEGTEFEGTLNSADKNYKIKKQSSEKRIIKADMENFMRFCILSSCIEKDINWPEISYLFSRSKTNLQTTFNAEIENNGGEEWLSDKRNDCRDFLLSVIKTNDLEMEDVEKLRYLKIIELWIRYEKLMIDKPIILLEDVSEFRKRYKLSSEKNFDRNKSMLFSDKSYFKTSLVKKYKGLLRKEYYFSKKGHYKRDMSYSSIRCALKSVLLDQIGKNNKHSKVNIEVISSYVKQYDSSEINSVVSEFSNKKLVLLNNNTLQLNDFFIDAFLKLNQTEFFQKYKQNKVLINDSFVNGKTIAIDDEMSSSLMSFVAEKLDDGKLSAVTLNGKYKPSLGSDTKYHIKNEAILDTALLLFHNKDAPLTISSENIVFSAVPGLGIPYSRMWINGEGDVRSDIWKVCLSYMCHQLYLKPELNINVFYTAFKTCLDLLEIEELMLWIKENKILKNDETHCYEFIDLDIASMLF